MDPSAGRPVHLWMTAVLAALWNAFGALDYSMTQLRSPVWMTQITEAQTAWLEAAPWWANGAWALGVWGGLAGSLLLLMRSRHAVTAFIVSLAGLAVNTLYQALTPMPGGHMSSGMEISLHLAIWVIAIGLLVYALRMRKRDVLR